MRTALLLALLLSDTLRPGVLVKDEGTTKGQATALDCTGAGVTCSVSGQTATISVPGGGGSYTLPGATNTTLGGIIVGSGLSITAGNVLSATSGGALPVTTALLEGNGAGGAVAYTGASCVAPGAFSALSSDGAATCYTIKVSELANPAGDTNWTWPSGTKMLWTFTGSTDNAFSVHGDGSFTGVGDLMHVHKTGTGSAAGADALHVEVDTDPQMVGLRVTSPAAGSNSIVANGVVRAPTFIGALTGNASTATALSTTGAAGTYWSQNNTWQTPPGTYSLPTASATLGGVKMAAACAAGNHVGSIVAGELTCSADAGGGGGADALGRYLVQIATNAPVNAQVMASLGTGLVKNTTATGVQSIAVSGTDYGPPTSGNATGLIISTTTTGAHTAYAGTTAGANQWINAISASGVGTFAQPAFTNISGTATDAQIGGPYLPRGGAAASANLINGAVVTVATTHGARPAVAADWPGPSPRPPRHGRAPRQQTPRASLVPERRP
jgi:hypothetical protein